MIVIAGGKIRASGLISEVRNRVVGASRLIAEIHGPKQDIEAGISKLKGVKSVDSRVLEGWNRLRIESGDGQDVREQIAALAASNNWSLRELRQEVGSLEEFFIQITAEAAGADAKEEQG